MPSTYKTRITLLIHYKNLTYMDSFNVYLSMCISENFDVHLTFLSETKLQTS